MSAIHDATDQAPRHASPVDYAAYGQYGPGRGFTAGQAFNRPRYRFQGRITADGGSEYQAEPGRYHLYIAWGLPVGTTDGDRPQAQGTRGHRLPVLRR